MRNEHLRDANHVSLPVPNGTAVGTPLRVGVTPGGLNVVTKTKTGAAGEPDGGNVTGYASCALAGSFTLTFAGAGAPGDPVYITAGGTVTMTATSNTEFGNLLETKATGTNAARVRLKN